MGLLEKVFGRKSEDTGEQVDLDPGATPGPQDDVLTREESPAPVVEIAAAPAEPTADLPDPLPPDAASGIAPADGIRAFDQNGREVIVPREEWRTHVLPGMLREAWDKPDALYLLIVNSMNDGFFAEVAEAAEHLYTTDPVPARGACMWGIALMQTGRLDRAEAVLSGFLAAHGDEGSVLTNLAKVYAMRGDGERAEQTLWRALEVEPNLDNGLGWYASMYQERGGDDAAAEALERVRQMPASWRAQLWLARAALGAGQLDGAKALYREALERAPRPVPGDFLMQMSGDLGGHGHLPELLEFTAPYFQPELHGLPVGNNLIKASLDRGDVQGAEAIVTALAGLGRSDWKGSLEFWSGEISRLRGGNGMPAQGAQELQIGMLRIDGPIWLPAQSPAQRLFGTKAASGPSVTFLGGTAEAPSAIGQGASEIADRLGRMTRSIPLFLAEQVEMLGAANGRAMLPWAVSHGAGQPSGFVVSGQSWPDGVAVQSAGAEGSGSDYVVSVHIDAEVEPWTADLAFVRTDDGARIGELTREFDPVDPEEGLCGLATEVLELLGEAERSGAEAEYEVPSGPEFGAYLLRLEQLLAIRCAGMEGVSAQFLSGEREILAGDLELCRAEPDNAVARVLLVETLAAVRAIRPEIASEFLLSLRKLEAEQPLPAVAAAFA